MTACCLCHTCATPLRTVLDGESWCATCETYQRSISHGWKGLFTDPEPCPLPSPAQP